MIISTAPYVTYKYLLTTLASSPWATLKKKAESKVRPTGHCITGSGGRELGRQGGDSITSRNIRIGSIALRREVLKSIIINITDELLIQKLIK